jgi:hypothetical protein
MALALNDTSTPYGANANWVKRAYQGYDGGTTDPGRISAFNIILSAFQSIKSPVIVPLFGQADHWATIIQLNLWDTAGTGHQIGDLKTVKYYEGGPPGAEDSSGNSYPPAGAPSTYTAKVFGDVYYKMLTAIDPDCDPNCTTDPYWHKYVLMYEPPNGYAPPFMTAVLSDSPGLVPSRQHLMSTQLAQTRMVDALVLAGIHTDQETWRQIVAGIPGTAHEVKGVFPSGAPWDYYLIPVLSKSNSNTAISFVQLATDDGQFQGVHSLSKPIPYDPVSLTEAQALAQELLAAGESLANGTLTWDARSITSFGKSPTQPYYEFDINTVGNQGKVATQIRVMLNGGAASRI